MKTYEPRRNNACPNGLHPDYEPAKDPSQNECTCPWLIIQSSSPVQHLTSWNRRETENFIREVDRGYFDPPGYPKRTGSMFLSPAMQRLLDVAEKEPVAAALTLLAGSGSGLPPFDAVAWDAEDACLSVRVPGLGWRRLWLGHANVEAVTDSDFTTAGGANPMLLWADHPDTARETAMPKLNAAWHHEECACDLNDPQQQAGCQRADEFSAAYLPEEVSGDVYAEDILNVTPIFDATSIVLPQRVPQVPSDIAEAGHGDYCTCDLNTRYTCPLCRAAQEDTPIAITRGGAQFPIDVPEDVFHAAQVKECGWALVEYAGTFVCNLPANHGNNHSDSGRAWYDSGTDDCTCDIRGSAPDTYACPEHPADARCAVPVRVLYPGDDINISTAYCEKTANHGDVHAGGGFAWSYDELEITAPKRRYAPDVIA